MPERYFRRLRVCDDHHSHSSAADDSALRLRIREITETRVHYGYRRVHVILRREDWGDNHKRIYRLYSEKGLSLHLKRPRRNKSAQRRQPQPQELYPNHVWGMDFFSDTLFDGRRLRLLKVIDLYTRECLGICVGQNLRSIEVAGMLDSIVLRRPLPQLLKTDNGCEFAGKCWTSGCMKEVSGSTSHAREHRRTTRRWSPSTAG